MRPLICLLRWGPGSESFYIDRTSLPLVFRILLVAKLNVVPLRNRRQAVPSEVIVYKKNSSLSGLPLLPNQFEIDFNQRGRPACGKFTLQIHSLYWGLRSSKALGSCHIGDQDATHLSLNIPDCSDQRFQALRRRIHVEPCKDALVMPKSLFFGRMIESMPKKVFRPVQVDNILEERERSERERAMNFGGSGFPIALALIPSFIKEYLARLPNCEKHGSRRRGRLKRCANDLAPITSQRSRCKCSSDHGRQCRYGQYLQPRRPARRHNASIALVPRCVEAA